MLALLAQASHFRPGIEGDNPWLWTLLIEWPICLAPALFTWLLPDLLRYSKGGMAWVGAGMAVLLTVLLPLQLVFEPWDAWYGKLHPWLYGVFYLYAFAGLALCAVGIFDRKRSAVWALLGVLSLTIAAIADTVIWFGWATGQPWVPWGFIGFWICLVIGYIRRSADKLRPPDMISSAKTLANNLTRRSRSIPRKLLREGNLHLLPVFYLLNLSDLGHEGIERSGSYRFADHIYRNQPSGRTWLGRKIDAVQLASPACVAFRNRYERARDEMQGALSQRPDSQAPLRILAIPCGLPRDLTELAERLARENPALLSRLEYHGMDLDEELLGKAREFTAGCGVPKMEFHHGNALLAETFPPGPFHFVVSTGLNEFLEARELECFYRNVYEVLAPGGAFFTSATRREKTSDWLMRAFELITRYRTPGELEGILSQSPWTRLKLVQHETGLQTFVTAIK